jgi:hypothetical protein
MIRRQVERYLIESNRQRVKTEEQRGREIIELLRIEKSLAAERMKSGKKADPSANLRKGRALSLAAETLGVGTRTAEKLLKLIEAVDAGDDLARALLDGVNAKRKSIDGAFREWKSKRSAN